ncbi:phosphatidate cytidylyltransferase [Oleiagrimonas sp. MCCC 1A03011]|uniref:phosphatidate cytidylyltransferase n=1 Tax=Oleiagrimonas sp. MCCC 1A03011 TaxID=1926883 RepID=UPI000DC4C5C3|nr:phosphatidate cytidylyltransferase [Oleiagrimonas sp. MCCC 1A03011]RAP57425.1 phosphatidate cytidylyltransferase [Oleiagrimonas sp. MCCC 1A03011]
MLLQRILTALILIPLALAVMLLPPTWLFGVIVGAVFLAAQWEWTRLCGVRKVSVRLAWLTLTLIALIALWILRAQTWIWTLGVAVGVLWWLTSLLWLRHYSFAASPTHEHVALKLTVGLLIFIPSWLALIGMHGEARGPWWVLLAILLVWAADTGAYFSGRLFGKRKLAPRISPGKTWAGVYGALILGGAVSVIGGWLLDIRHPIALLGMLVLGVVTVAASILGDLIESLFKRQADIKDSGTLFPGHGGLLDRLDSVFAALPVFVIAKLLLGL